MQRDFTTIVTELDDGKVHQKLTDGLAEVVRAVMTHGQNGSVTLTLKLSKEGRMATVSADVKSKVPKGKTETTPFFTTDDGELRKEDPRQQTLKNLQVVPKGPPRVVPNPVAAAGNEPSETRE